MILSLANTMNVLFLDDELNLLKVSEKHSKYNGLDEETASKIKLSNTKLLDL